MRAVRYTGAAITAGVLAVAVATVAAAHTDRTASSSVVVHVDAGVVADGATHGTGLTIHVTAGTSGAPLLTIDGHWSDGPAPARDLSFHGRPAIAGLRADADLGSASIDATFTARDGSRHRLFVDLHRTGAVDAWTEGPFAPGTAGAVAAVSACDARAVHASAALFLDGIAVTTDPSALTADIVARDCSTVALHR